MDIEAVRTGLSAAMDAVMPGERRIRAAREWLIKRGAETFQIAPQPGMALDLVIKVAIGAASTEARREFAVMLICALGIEGVLPTRGESERLVRSFLEQALLDSPELNAYQICGADIVVSLDMRTTRCSVAKSPILPRRREDHVACANKNSVKDYTHVRLSRT
jgi:hypothetical protein